MRSRSCASSRAASTRPCSPTAASARRSSRSPTGRRSSSSSTTLPDERLPAPVEAAAFYVVAEALTNVAKYADASSVRVSVERLNGRAVVEVADDGRGGADPAKGTGLRGLVDRVSALDGTLSVDSPEGGGTRVRAEIPDRRTVGLAVPQHASWPPRHR